MKAYLVERLGVDGAVEKRHWFSTRDAAATHLDLLLEIEEERSSQVTMIDTLCWLIVDNENREHLLYVREAGVLDESELATLLRE